MCLSREATQQCFKEYIDQCIEEFCVAQEQRIALLHEAQERHFQQLECRIKECRADAYYRIKKFCAEAEQRIKECRAEAYQLIRECRAEYRADAEQCIKKLRADAEQQCPVCKGVVGEEKLVPLYGKGRSVTDPRTKIPPLPSDIHTLFGSLEQMRLSREATQQCFKEYIDQCIEEFCVAQEQRIVLLHEAQERHFQQLECRIKECRADAYYRIKKFCAEAEQRIKECRAEAYQLIRECRAEYRADAEQCIKKLRADAEQQCPVCKGVVGEEKLVPLYGKGRSVTDPRTEIPPRPSDIHTLFASLEQTRLSHEATEQRFKEYIDQCIEEFCVAQEQRIALLHEAQERYFQQLECRIKECRADAYYRIKKFCAEAEQQQRINEIRAECRVETEQRIKECHAETEQRIKECRVEYCAAAGQRIKECREEAEQQCPVCKGVVGEEKLVPLYGKGRSVTDPRTKISPRPSDIHTLFASLEQMHLSREATQQCFKEYIDQCIEEFCVAQEQHIALPQEAQERRFQQLECRIKECRADADYRIKKFCAEAEQRIKECRAKADQLIRECRAEYRADAEQRIKKLRADAEQRITEFRSLHHRSHPQECPVCKGVVGEEKLVPLYGKGRSVTDPRTEIPPRPSDIHTLFASLEQTRLSREATEQRFKEYID
ncbi:uncharacterized protein LOC127123688 [Lathyrus oleraceus]|uniref:uncharacterized protein LOC127123688 n=1 Tax=Pisum sativum TaxID=3888 RepID=UPI0021CDEFEF|nr:uncharacterized protein LOC127123688 [Pisum sativum]